MNYRCVFTDLLITLSRASENYNNISVRIRSSNKAITKVCPSIRSVKMKFCVAIISLVLCSSFVMAEDDCPSICPFDYSPVCGEAMFEGRLVRCQFSNECKMRASVCYHNIEWRPSGCENSLDPCRIPVSKDYTRTILKNLPIS